MEKKSERLCPLTLEVLKHRVGTVTKIHMGENQVQMLSNKCGAKGVPMDKVVNMRRYKAVGH